MQRSTNENTNLVNALESHWYNKMLEESYDQKSERNRTKSHGIDTRQCMRGEEVIKRVGNGGYGE